MSIPFIAPGFSVVVTLLQDVPGKQTGLAWPASLTALPFTLGDQIVETKTEALEVIDALEWLLCADIVGLSQGQMAKARKGREILAKIIEDIYEGVHE